MEICAACGEVLDDDGLCAPCLLGGVLDATVPMSASVGASAPSGVADDLSFDSFGPYAILRVLGEGGMGAVYLAQQSTPISRKVALKVIKPGLDSGSILSRFNYERQTLAMMDHPNIARVYDASATAKGRPYFVMEYIEGEPITTYCDTRQLDTRARLELFIPVCLAVQHAHSKGILHRDIKPSNVMVTEVDGRPVPKVIDFGIAKATDQHSHDQTVLTQFGQFVGTPEYMSPEAADLVGGGVDTASDVYSLGVLLYELLVGAVPFDSKALSKAGMAELLRILREVAAPSLPAKLTSMGQAISQIAERRASTPIALRKLVGGELNLITLKAVEKDRELRYASPRELGEDIQRFLESRPVKACPPTLSYRVRKFAGMHRGAVAAGIALAVTIASGTAATLWQARTAIAQRAEAIAQRTEAQTQRADALLQRFRAEAEARHADAEMRRAAEQEQLALAGTKDIRSLANSMLFQLDDQLKNTGSTAARTTLLNLGLQYLQKADSSDPNLGAAWFRVAELQESLRDLDRAEASYRQSAQLLRQRLAREPRHSESRRLLALVRLAQAGPPLGSGTSLNWLALGDSYEGHEANLLEAETRLKALLADEPSNAQAMLDLSRVLVSRRRPREAVTWSESAIRAGARGASGMVALSAAQVSLSNWVVDHPGASEGIVWAQRAVSTVEEASRQAPVNTKVWSQLSLACANLAFHYGVRDEQEKALVAVNRARDAAQQAVAIDPESPINRVELARRQGDLALMSSSSGNMQEFRTRSEEVTRLFREQIERHPDVPQHLLDKAEWLVGQGGTEFGSANFGEAVARLLPASQELRGMVARDPRNRKARHMLTVVLSYLGQAHMRLREYPAARAVGQESVAMARRALGGAPGISELTVLHMTETFLALSLNEMGQKAAALEHISAAQEAIRQGGKTFELDRDMLAFWSSGFNAAATFYNESGDFVGMRVAIEKVATPLEAAYRENPYDSGIALALLNTLFNQRTLSRRTGHMDGMLAASRRAVEVARKLAVNFPENLTRQQDSVYFTGLISFDLRQAGLRDEALAANREAATAVRARLASPPVLTDTALQAFNLAEQTVRYFVDLNEPGEACALGMQLVPALESLVRKDPANRRAADMLLKSLNSTANGALSGGLLAEARELVARNAELRVRLVPRTSNELYLLGQQQIQLANVEERLGNNAAARRERDAALAALKTSFAVSEKALADSKGQSVAELSNMQAVRTLNALLAEQQGQPEVARKAATEALQLAERLAATENTRANRDLRQGAQARVLRLLDMSGAPAGEFPPLTTSSARPSSPEEKAALLAEGWRLTVFDLGNYSADPATRHLAAERTVAEYRNLVRASSSPQSRIELARGLSLLALARVNLSRCAAQASEQARHLEASLQPALESVEILQPLMDTNKLPEPNQPDWTTAKIRLAFIQSKLAAAPGANSASR